MKYILLLSIILSTQCFAQSTTSDCSVSALFRHVYQQDVNKLALIRLYEIKSEDTGLILVPQKYIDTIWQGLSAIYNTGNNLGADSIFNKYCIHRYLYRGAEIELYVNNSDWTKAWENNQTITGYKPLDYFLASYGFELISFSQIMNYRVATILSMQPVNTHLFAKTLEHFNGVYSAYDNPGRIGFPDEYISYSRDTVSHFNFYMGWGDCPAGCTSAQYWNYDVDNNCNVTKTLGTWVGMDTYPYPKNCNVFPSSVINPSAENMSGDIAFPNPASNVINIRLSLENDMRYVLKDALGKTIMAGNIANRQIDIAELAPGYYHLLVTTKDGRVYSQKIIKYLQ